MSAAWPSIVEIAVPIIAFGATLTVDLWLLAIAPPRRRLLSLLVIWTGCLVAVVPVALIEGQPAWLLAALFGGIVAWGRGELRMALNHWIYVTWPERRRQENAFRGYKPKAFDD